MIAGLDKISETEYKPVICTYDSIGYREHSDIFEVAGTGAEFLQGVCETFYKPNLEPEQLFEVVSNCLLSALDRDSLSGWGAYVYILTPTELIVRSLKTRMDWHKQSLCVLIIKQNYTTTQILSFNKALYLH